MIHLYMHDNVYSPADQREGLIFMYSNHNRSHTTRTLLLWSGDLVLVHYVQRVVRSLCRQFQQYDCFIRVFDFSILFR